MGAEFAMRCTVEHNDGLIDGLVLDSPYRHIGDVVRRKMSDDGVPSWPNLPLAMAWLSRHCPAFRKRDTLPLAQQIHLPTLVFHGGEDSLIAVETAQQIADALKSPLVVFEEADHLDGVTQEPARYQSKIEELIARLDAPAASGAL
jgi:pimeloyl-ACP methyl ester carboxylesterase